MGPHSAEEVQIIDNQELKWPIRVIVVAVEYLNTRPFVFGIRHFAAADSQLRDSLLLAPPADCARLAANGNADIALVPIGALSILPEAKIITSYCLSSSGGVRTVALLTNTPVNQLHTIYLDSHSRTSVELARLLARSKWLIAPRFVDGLPADNQLLDGEAMVAIGDKVFELEDRFAINLDLSDQWREMTGLPFVFAVWVALTPCGLAAEAGLNKALEFGIQNIERALPDDPLRPRNLHYLTHSIEYELTDAKRSAMKLFLSEIS